MSKNERGWSFHNLVGFMESHDEERLMYNNLLYGNSTIGYDIKDVETSLQRMGLAAAFFYRTWTKNDVAVWRTWL